MSPKGNKSTMAGSSKRTGDVPSIRRRQELSVVIPPSGRDAPSIDSAVKEWIVPLLVKEFLREQEARSAETEVKPDDPTTEPLGKEGAAINRIR